MCKRHGCRAFLRRKVLDISCLRERARGSGPCAEANNRIRVSKFKACGARALKQQHACSDLRASSFVYIQKPDKEDFGSLQTSLHSRSFDMHLDPGQPDLSKARESKSVARSISACAPYRNRSSASMIMLLNRKNSPLTAFSATFRRPDICAFEHIEINLALDDRHILVEEIGEFRLDLLVIVIPISGRPMPARGAAIQRQSPISVRSFHDAERPMIEPMPSLFDDAKFAPYSQSTASRKTAARDLPCSAASWSSHLMSSSGRSARMRVMIY